MSGRAIRAHPTFKSGSYLILIPYVVLIGRVRIWFIFDKDCRLTGVSAPYSRLSSCVYYIYMEYAVFL